ncbi:MAG TPA: hypothetical protein VH575_13060 [Gemmataceae bacterium]
MSECGKGTTSGQATAADDRLVRIDAFEEETKRPVVSDAKFLLLNSDVRFSFDFRIITGEEQEAMRKRVVTEKACRAAVGRGK